MILKLPSAEIWFSDRIIVDEKGFMRADYRIRFDKSLVKPLNFSDDALKVLEQARVKIPSENDYIKNLVDGF